MPVMDGEGEYTYISAGQAPLVLGFISNRQLAARVESAVEGAGYDLALVPCAEDIAPAGREPPRLELGEPLQGQGAVLIDKITRWRPVLIVFDLDNPNIPWRRWLPLIKSAPASRRIPVICLGRHLQGEVASYARSAGADVVLEISGAETDLSALIKQHARIINRLAILESCQQELSPLAVAGLEEFNRGEFFEAHETLELAWKADRSLGRELYRAILQVAVAYLQIERGNYRGAMKMFLRVRQWLDPLPDNCRGVQVARFREEAYYVHQVIQQLGEERLKEFDFSLIKPIQYSVHPK